MKLLLALGLAASSALMLGMQLPSTGGGNKPPRPSPCNMVLLPQYDSGGCVSSGNPICSGIPGSPECCQHFHQSLTWNTASHWVKPTGMVKGPTIKRYYSAREDFCSGATCVPGIPFTDSIHYQIEDTLVGCPQ
jgi:hypothetical protein